MNKIFIALLIGCLFLSYCSDGKVNKSCDADHDLYVHKKSDFTRMKIGRSIVFMFKNKFGHECTLASNWDGVSIFCSEGR